MNPANRTLLQVTIDDAAEADRTFDMLMGEAVDPAAPFHPDPRQEREEPGHLARGAIAKEGNHGRPKDHADHAGGRLGGGIRHR